MTNEGFTGIILNLLLFSTVHGLSRIGTDEDRVSTAGTSSELSDSEVAFIIIAVMVVIPSIVVIALQLHDWMSKRNSILPQKTEVKIQPYNETKLKVIQKKHLSSVKTRPVLPYSTRLQPLALNQEVQSNQPMGRLHSMRQGEVRPLPPIKTSVFTIQRPPTPPAYDTLYPGNAPY